MSNFAQTPNGQKRKSIRHRKAFALQSNLLNRIRVPWPRSETCRAKGNSVQLPAILQGELLRRLLQGAAAGAIATIIIGFSWGVSTLGSTAKKLATDETRNAIVTIAAPACAEHFANKANDEKWAEYQRVDVWRRDTYIKEAGYATATGLANDYSAGWAIAHACVKALNKLLEIRTK
jgi:hypothetical protein